MKQFFVIFSFVFSFNLLAFEKCMHTIDHSEIAIERIKSSQQLSFYNCPRSILLNGSLVRTLIQVKQQADKQWCYYGNLGTNLICVMDKEEN